MTILFFRDSGIAQCLEHDIAACGKSLETEQKEFERILNAELKFRKSRGGLEIIPPAPSLYHEMRGDYL